MATYLTVSVICGRCGAESEHDTLGSVSSFGHPDLDGRRPPPRRNTMSAWLQECPSCLYVARDLSLAPLKEADVVKEIGFIEAGLSENMPDLAIRFMRRAYIDAQIGRTQNAIWRFLHAAWVLDDFKLDATSPRMQAAKMVLDLGDPADLDLRLLRLDLLRRTAAFDETIAEADRLLSESLDENQIKVAAAQRRAASERRSEAVSFYEALYPRSSDEPVEPIPPDWRDIFP